MPAPLYSSLLWKEPAASGTTFSPEVPGGYVWDVVDICVVVNGVPFANEGGFAVTDLDLAPIFVVPNGSCPQVSYWHWSGRQILEAGEGLRFLLTSGTGGIRVTGFVLTTP